MSIYKSIASEIKAYGEKVKVISENGAFETKGIFQPLLYKNKLYLGGELTPDGFYDAGHYLLICPADVYIPTLGDVVFVVNREKYMLKRSQVVRSGGRDLYVWAVVHPCNQPVEEEFI